MWLTPEVHPTRRLRTSAKRQERSLEGSQDPDVSRATWGQLSTRRSAAEGEALMNLRDQP